MQCEVEEKVVRSMRMMGVKCFKCGKEGHKCRECPLWIQKKNEERAVHVASPQKAQQKEWPAHPIKGKAQERKLRRVEGSEATHPTKGNTQQGE